MTETAGSKRPKSLRQEATQKIRTAILEGRYAPNSILSENELAEEYSISRTPIREALRELSVKGLVRVLPKRGIIVTELTPREIMSLYQVREALECYAVALVAEKHSEEDAEAFLREQRETETLLAARNYHEAYNSAIKMHKRIIELTGNLKMKQILDDLSDQVYRIGMMTLRHGRSETSIKEHAAIIERIIARDGAQAASLMRAHLVTDRDVVLTQILDVGFLSTSMSAAAAGFK